MSDATTEVKDPATDATPAVEASMGTEDTASFTERYSEVLGKVNDTLDQVDWNQMGRIGKIVGIFAAVIVAQILIKGILDTINLLPVVPGLLELLGVSSQFLSAFAAVAQCLGDGFRRQHAGLHGRVIALDLGEVQRRRSPR